jgi:CCR4-NOT transcriptional complex subunit CAF120
VLSISTAGKNRYLLHFNSHHSLIQWTAGIRLAMFEHSSLQEAYTGALIGGKGKTLNNIAIIMERAKIKHEDWVRVRFGAGTPWRRCWCVITPPDEREYQKLVKEMNKKKSAYDKSKPPVLKGDVKFYENKKTKKAKPIAQISNAYSAFAIYPQSKPLIDASTLIKLEGIITIFSSPPTSVEGFVFVMPEVHPAVSGFEMMLRWLFPVWDTFALYGRPGRLLADTVNPNSLMFAMPKERRYGYLEILDVSGLILTEGSQNWSEMEWRRNMKELTARRMETIGNGSRTGSRYSRRSNRNSFGAPRNRVEFNDGASIRSNPSVSRGQGPPTESPMKGATRTDLAPPGASALQPPNPVTPQHYRSASESQGLDRYPNQGLGPSGYDGELESGPTPPPHSTGYSAQHQGSALRYEKEMIESPERVSSEDELAVARSTPVRELQDLRDTRTPEPVAAPPAFAHAPGTLPPAKPYHSPELRREKARMSNATLAQMAGASGMATGAGLAAAFAPGTEQPRTSEEQRWQNMARYTEDSDQRGVLSNANQSTMNANPNGLPEGLVVGRANRPSFEYQAPPPAPTPPIPEHQYLPSNSNYPQYAQEYSNRSLPPQPTAPKASPQFKPYETPGGYAGPMSHPQQQYPAAISSQSASLDGQRQGHVHTSSTASTQSQLLRTSQTISRKPLPLETSQPPLERPLTQSASSSGSVGNVIDQAGFDQVVSRDRINAALTPEPQIHPQTSNASLYEDTASNTSPDYASTRPSTDTKKSFERPRAGVLRTVGGTEDGHSNDSRAANELSSEIPSFDFGPTVNYAPKLASNQPSPPRKASPARKQSPANQPGQANRSRVSPEPGQYRNEPNANTAGRAVPWQPGMAAVRSSSPSRQAITPEQFVQQRAAAVTQPRQPPVNLMRSGTPTPPGRSPSGESFSHSRNNSSDMLQRPNSRGTAAALGTGDYSTHLSAKEQEHVARVTGSPLINNPAGDNRGAAPNTGLVGAIDAREREKRDMKQGINSQAVQQAIVQRQQQAQVQQQYQQQAQAQPRVAQQPQYQGAQQYPQQYGGQRSNPQSALATGGQSQNYQPPQQYPPHQRQQSYMSSAASVFAQGGGWTSPQQRPQTTADQQRLQYNISPAAAVFAQGGGWTSPPSSAEQQQQYFQQQQQYLQPQQQGPGPGRGQGRGGQGYPGQGF